MTIVVVTVTFVLTTFLQAGKKPQRTTRAPEDTVPLRPEQNINGPNVHVPENGARVSRISRLHPFIIARPGRDQDPLTEERRRRWVVELVH